MDKYEKKGQMAGNAVNNIIVLIVGVGVAVLVLIFVGSLGGETYNIVENDINAIANNVIVSESFIANNVTAQKLAHGFIQINTLHVFNATQEIGLGNFTVNANGGTILGSYSPGFTSLNGTTMSANYTWGAAEVRRSVQNGIVSGFNAIEQTGDYLPIIVLAVVIALVLALVLGFSAFGGGRSTGRAL